MSAEEQKDQKVGKPQEVLKLRNGTEMPLLGLGTWLSAPGEVGAAVKAAVKAGYLHIDCAAIYGNETEVGAALRELFQEGIVRREDLWITSKLWNTEHPEASVLPAIRKTLTDLGLEYLDLYLVHWPTAFPAGRGDFPQDEHGFVIPADPLPKLTETWKGMEAALQAGLTKAIGVSNFNRAQLQEILDAAQTPPAVLQIESHPYLTNQELIDFARSHGIEITAYSPLAHAKAVDGDKVLLEDPILKQIASAHGKTPAQVLIRYQMDRKISVIPKSVKEHRIRENFDVHDFQLTPEELEKLNGLNLGKVARTCDPSFVNEKGETIMMISKHPQYPFAADF